MTVAVSSYAALLARVQSIAPEAHIAGGAVRDTILQRQIADIDLFMLDTHVEPAAALLRSACGYVKVGEWQQYLGFSDPAMTRVAKFEKADETTPVCIIGLTVAYANPEANLARFDFGICMAAFDGKQITRTSEFDRDMEGQMFTLLRADSFLQFTYSMSRFNKITRDRYQGWSLTVPEEFAALAHEYAIRKHWYTGADGALGAKGLAHDLNLLRPKARGVDQNI
jgi:hypothetical protein